MRGWRLGACRSAGVEETLDRMRPRAVERKESDFGSLDAQTSSQTAAIEVVEKGKRKHEVEVEGSAYTQQENKRNRRWGPHRTLRAVRSFRKNLFDSHTGLES